MFEYLFDVNTEGALLLTLTQLEPQIWQIRKQIQYDLYELNLTENFPFFPTFTLQFLLKVLYNLFVIDLNQ